MSQCFLLFRQLEVGSRVCGIVLIKVCDQYPRPDGNLVGNRTAFIFDGKFYEQIGSSLAEENWAVRTCLDSQPRPVCGGYCSRFGLGNTFSSSRLFGGLHDVNVVAEDQRDPKHEIA